MNRSTLDKLISSTGLIIAVASLAASATLFYAHNFVHTQVVSQLSEQKITFPQAGSAGLTALPSADQTAVGKYAGQQVLTGAQAEVFADHYINVHIQKIGAGKTYAELSAAAQKDPTNAALNGQVQIIFRGETLRGLLLNAYAFDTMATVANYAAYGTLVAGAVLFVLAILGFSHAGRAQKSVSRKR